MRSGAMQTSKLHVADTYKLLLLNHGSRDNRALCTGIDQGPVFAAIETSVKTVILKHRFSHTHGKDQPMLIKRAAMH